MPSQRSQSSMNNAIAQVLSIIDDPMRRMARIHLTRLHSHSQTSTMKNSIDSNATKDAEMHNDEIHPNGHYDEQRSEKHAANTDLVGCNNEKHSEKVKRRVLNTGDAHVEPMDGIIVNGSGVSCIVKILQIGEEECTSYLYPYCGMGVEADDRPIKYEANCLDICFTIQEKHLRPFLDHYPVNRQ
ncbi:unnamed protein product [Anisakis simplex]|uniref:Methyltranfer_dom domain-containing protein n=1 Tax=Anisakis simplex TaxID=6269 RepID=A0A0M3JSQ4_ANISI|nr:unnamed protein product [Anisakis simplex]